MSQESNNEMYDDWIDSKLVDLCNEFYENPVDKDPDQYYQDDKDFRAYCEERFESYCASASDWAYDQYKDNQLNT